MATTNTKKGGKNRKYGRMAKSCQAYTAGGMQEKNQKRRLRRHLLSYPEDAAAVTAYEKIFGKVGDIRVVSDGKSTQRTMTARAARKLKRKYSKEIQLQRQQARAHRRFSRKKATETPETNPSVAAAS